MTDVNATIVLDIFQAMAPRQRHIVDGQAISALNLLMQTAYDKGARVIGTATSPNDIPIEFRNSMATRIITTSTEKTQIRAIDGLTDCGIKACALHTNGGISFSKDNEAWIVPGHNAHPDQLLLIGIPATKTCAGPRGVKHPRKSDVQDAANKAVLTARPKNKKGKKAKPRGASSAAPQMTTAQEVGSTPSTVQNSLRQAGVTYYTQVGPIVGAMHRFEQGKMNALRSNIGTQEALDMIARMPTIAAAGRWVFDNKKHFGDIASGGILGAAYAIATSEDRAEANAFFADMLRPKSPSSLLTALSNLEAPLIDMARMKTILDAWRLHLVTTAQNAPGMAACA